MSEKRVRIPSRKEAAEGQAVKFDQDKIPYEPYQRNRPIYECRCRSGFFF